MIPIPVSPMKKHGTQIHQSISRWLRNTFAKANCDFLRRRLLSSGPGNMTDQTFNDGDGNDAGPKENRAGWRTGTKICCVAVIVCIVIEISLLSWASSASINAGLLFEGNCLQVKNKALWLLLPLNIAATILIGSSNYVLQILAAPSRSEIDQAHNFAQATVVCGLRFGVPKAGSGRWNKRPIWWILVLSSLPIHLLLNSAFYGSVQASNTGVLVLSNGFDNDLSAWRDYSLAAWNDDSLSYMGSTPSFSFAFALVRAFKNGKTVELSREECISQYARGFQTNASSVIVVAAENSDPWYCPPREAKFHPKVGEIACQSDTASAEHRYVPASDSQRNFRFLYQPKQGELNVSLYLQVCKNVTRQTNSAGSQMWSLEYDKDQSGETKFRRQEQFLFGIEDALTNMTSVQSVFSATNYRYWATAELTGNYLNEDYQALLDDRDKRSWLCPSADLKKGQLCDPKTLLAKSIWKITPAEIPVEKCHVYAKPERCALRYSWRILLITIICDFIKLCAMVFTLIYVTEPLITIGDVIASFLQDPDPCTQSQHLLGELEAIDLENYWIQQKPKLQAYQSFVQTATLGDPVDGLLMKLHNINVGYQETSQLDEAAQEWLMNGGPWWGTAPSSGKARQWKPRARKWSAAISETRLVIFTFTYLSAIVAAAVYFSLSLKALRSTGSLSIWTAGFHEPDPNALWQGGLLSGINNISVAAIVVNAPQLLYAMLYFSFNNLFTGMHTAREWNDFAKHRKALRVSSPKGQQRSTYWLQLPWKYSIPLATASALLHWLLGRSLYLVKVEAYDYFEARVSEGDFFACGYSLSTTLVLVILLACMGLALFVVSRQKLEGEMPLVKFNSLAISAACHPDPSEKNIALRPLMWGILQDENGVDTQHCSFSARTVSPLREGDFYS